MTGEGEMIKSQSIKMSEYWAEQLKAMPYLSSKYKLLCIANMTSLNRKTCKDPGPAQDQKQAHSCLEEEKEGANQGHLLELAGEQAETSAGTWYGAAA